MKKLLVSAAFIFAFSIVSQVSGQERTAVGAAEVNGTFRAYFSGKYKGNYDEVKILSVGKGKLRVAFGLIYPSIDGTGEMSANTGEADGTATIEGDRAIYSSDEFGQCRITIKFVKSGEIKITQSGTDTDCGFGHNVSAHGTYKKIDNAKPKFDTTQN